MKEKFKKFILEKKELLIFIGVVVFVFASVIAVAGIALSNTETNEVINNLPSDDIIDEPSSTDDDTNNDNEPVVIEEEVFELPISGEYVIVRSYFDITLSDEELEAAIITNGESYETSKGISYAKADDSVFDVLSIYDGEVVDIVSDELAGSTITIKHSDDVTSIYYSLSDITVSIGDDITRGQKLGISSTSINDTEASVHVHLEVEVNNNKVNPTSVFGKTLDDLVDGK